MPSPAHHAKAGGFCNPWSDSQLHGVGGLLKWMLTRSGKRKLPNAAQTPLGQPRQLPAALPDNLSVTWIGHSTFLVRCDGVTVLTDPIWSERASPVSFAGPRRIAAPGILLDDIPLVDITVLSHDHYDHLDDATVRNLIKRFPAMAWIAPVGVGDFLRRRGATTVFELDWWEEMTLGHVNIGCTPAQHFSGRYPWNRNATLWCGWSLRFEHASLFFAGDTGLHPEFYAIAERFGPFDASILPIGAYDPRWFMKAVHMSPEEAVGAFEIMQAANPHASGRMIGSHWGTFRLTDEPVDEPPVLARQTWKSAALPPEDLWIMSHGETRTVGKAV
jgi:N-acyl-phosphatidylethanolamine-hydrolysing phospholipase D